MQNQPLQPFQIFESFVGGFRLLWLNSRIILRLSFFSFAVTLMTIVLLRVLNENLSLFWLPILQLPSSFVTGLQCALILRLLILGEHPLAPEGEERSIRNRAITHAAIAYTAVTYLITGIYAGLLNLQKFLQTNPEAAAPYMPLGVVILAGMLWGARWFWLHIPMAVDWPVAGFYSRLGKWAGSLRVFALFAMCSLTMNFLTGFLRAIVNAVLGAAGGGFAAAFDDAVVAAMTLLLSLLFTCVSVVAVQHMTQEKKP